ncbi:uncharacterized protein EI97DRAFT_441883 [Westerdykella ornata]|uniref:C2H2-type domain-containing protein n=1 Tax=Westerdykella ornata TaxID=318751 RepID=A0A6A6JKX3_WESOR|nr:uncharacterized protein EI97DRAFT_441883 [Westerdykella ornata]KAF2277132.1 hypothetical protein EI97DRAFT_441883 [Westerdykella ornata]
MEPEEPQVLQYTPQHSNSFKRPRRSLQSSTPLSSVCESASPSPRLSGQPAFLTPEVIEHINALKHLKDDQIFLLLQAARNGGQSRRHSARANLTMSPDHTRLSGPDRSSMSTVGSRASSYLSVPSSRVTSMLSDPRSSIASTDSSFTNYSATSTSRLSTTSCRPLSTASTASAPKNFVCTFCEKALKSKPYWKSHEEEFHEQRLTWRCPDCEQLFHAGKRFREHHTKLHGCEDCKQPRESGQPTSRKASPCVKKYELVMHDKDAWGCGFCASLLTTWEERCEHIALHFEEKRNKWNFTNVILGLLKQADVAPAWQALLTQRHGEEQNWPQLTWESKKCNRLRYKLETKWDNRAFDIDALVRETYELADIDAAASNDAPEVKEPATNEISADCKLESFEIPTEHTLPSSQEIPADTSMMELDSVDVHDVSQPELQQSQWPVATDMSQAAMSSEVNMGAFGGYPSHMSSMSTDFTQHVSHSYHQPAWPDAGFASTPDLVNFQQQGNYMTYTPTKGVIQVPTSQFSSFARPASQHSSQQAHTGFSRPSSQHTSQHPMAAFSQYQPRQSVPPNFLHHSSSTGSRKYIPRLINITSSAQRAVHGDQPPPPPPKDDHRFSRIMMRRRPSNISQHTVVAQQGWNDEMNWG